MKKSLLKLTSLMLCLSMIGAILAGCSDSNNDDNDDDDDDCPHKYGEWYCEDEDEECQSRKYYKECTKCGDFITKKGSEKDHEFGEEITLSHCEHVKYTYKKCNICGKEHLGDPIYNDISYSDKNLAIKYTDEEHWIECEICNKTSEKGPHEFAYYGYNDTEHWELCACGFVGEKSSHNIDKNGYCNECDYIHPDFLSPLAGEYNITMWVSERETPDGYSVVEQFEEQIADFMVANPGIVIKATISGVTEADAGIQVVADVASAPDIFCFAQDQLPRLVQAGALAAPTGSIANEIKANNNIGSVNAASVGGTLYAYPMTSDNGYYLYYDKSIVKDPTSLEAIIADCESAYYNSKSNYLFRYALSNAWYNASFFFGAGCHSQWTMDNDGYFIDVYDNFNSQQGLVAMKGMQKLTKSIIYDSDAERFQNAAAIVTGIWNAPMAEEHFGENLGVCKLPTFTVDGRTYQLGSFSGSKLMGVKRQADSKRGAVLQLLAYYLTSEKCQLERYDAFQWGPSNLYAQISDKVQSNVHLAALAAQNAYSTPQGLIHGDWWNIAAYLGSCAKNATTDKELLEYLNEYELSINALIEITSGQK